MIESRFELVTIHLPVVATFAALVLGLGAGIVLSTADLAPWLQDTIALIGTLWLRALQMTIIPLVAALLVLGLSQMVEAASAGRAARRFLLLVIGVAITGGLFTAVALPWLLDMFQIPADAAGFIAEGAGEGQEVPGILDFLKSLIAPNIIAAAAETNMLPLTMFFALFAIAITRLPARREKPCSGSSMRSPTPCC